MGLIDALLDVVAQLIAPQWRRTRGRRPKEPWSVRRSSRRLGPRGEKDLEGFDDESVVVELGKA